MIKDDMITSFDLVSGRIILDKAISKNDALSLLSELQSLTSVFSLIADDNVGTPHEIKIYYDGDPYITRYIQSQKGVQSFYVFQ